MWRLLLFLNMTVYCGQLHGSYRRHETPCRVQQRTNAGCVMGTSPNLTLPSPVGWIFTIVARVERGGDTLFPPYFIAGSLGMILKMLVTLTKVSINCTHRLRLRSIVTIVNNRPSHATKDRLNDV